MIPAKTPLVQSVDLLRLAADLPTATLDKLAHALGWPDSRNIHRPRGRVKWRNPYRNYWSGTDLDPEWSGAMLLGLATKAAPTGDHPYTTWRVTDLGKAVVRLRLQALREVPR